MSQPKTYNLEQRTYEFALSVRKNIKSLPNTISNAEDSEQLPRSSGSVAANYIEANESVSDKDFLYRAKICRKEAKESALWLRLIINTNPESKVKGFEPILQESNELKKIFSAIINKRT